MTLLQSAMNLFSLTDSTDFKHIEPLRLTEIINSISSSSNEWNTAATRLAADHEKNPGKQATVNYHPIAGIKTTTKKRSYLSTSEWNALALGRIHCDNPEESSK